MLEITTKADELVKKYNMLSNGDVVVVGVSGGADSMALLTYLMNKRNDFALKLIVANVEHGIRGAESIEDTAFVEEYCKKNGVEFHSISIDAISGAKSVGMSVEEYSREKRYEFFNSFHANKIATAHNLSDNVETVLFRLTRGTSIKGMAGIPAVRDNIIRPFLKCTGEEIRNACASAGIPYRIDSTNNDNNYSRNNIRNNIVPLFREINPAFEEVVSRFIDSVAEDEDTLNKLADVAFDDCMQDCSLSLCELKKYDASVIKRVIIKLAASKGINLDEKHLSGISNLVFNQGKYQIKRNFFAVSNSQSLRICEFSEPIDFNKVRVEKRIVVREVFIKNRNSLLNEYDFYCDFDKISGEISVRSRIEGDSISPVNRKCVKTLKKLYNELHINIEDRCNIPVICDNEGIIGVYGYCVDERVKFDSDTISVMLLKILLED